MKADQVVLLDYEDGMLTSYPEAEPRKEIVYHIRRIQPDVVMSWLPHADFSLRPSQGNSIEL